MTTLNMMSDIEFESDNDDPNCLSVDELMNAVDNNSQFKTTKSDNVNHIQQQELLPLNALNSTATSIELARGCVENIRPFENSNNYEIDINNIEHFEFENVINTLGHYYTDSQNSEVIENEDISEETLGIPTIYPINDAVSQNIEVLEYEGNTNNNAHNDGKKRSKISNPNSWSRNTNKNKRLKGEPYIGYRRKEKDSTLIILHDTPREGRSIGPPCQSEVCKKWKTRLCLSIKPEDRLNIFNNFWSMTSWKEKQIFILSLIEKVIPKQ